MTRQTWGGINTAAGVIFLLPPIFTRCLFGSGTGLNNPGTDIGSGIMQGEGGSWRACLVIGVIIAVLLSGCTATRLSACCGQEPIIGTWFYDPAGSTGTSTDELTLFIVKDGGRFDAAAIPRNQTKPLTYEIWITGSWEKVGAYLYTLTGQSIHHDFVTDNHTTAEYKNTLSYHPDSDTLSPPSTVDPYGSFIRKSYKPEIPPGLNVSIPWD